MAFLNETKLARYTEKLWAQILNKIKVDTTLTEEGMAADAKAVGDALAEKQPTGDYALKNEVPSISGLASEDYVDNAIAAIPIDATLTQEGVAADANAVGDLISTLPNAVKLIDSETDKEYCLSIKNGNLITTPYSWLEVTPDTIKVLEGDMLNTEGIVVTHHYYDGRSEIVTDYTYTEIPSDTVEGDVVTIEISHNGDTIEVEVNIISIEKLLTDFSYIKNSNGTYTLTGWKQTLNGETSTECIIPDFNLINL